MASGRDVDSVPPQSAADNAHPGHQPHARVSSNTRTAPINIGSATSSRRQSLQLSSGSEQFPVMPRRHSRPMTPAELHLELEREQEGIVNRLSRELQTLRAHSSSMASNTSATSSHSQSQAPTPSSTLQPPTPSLASPPDNMHPPVSPLASTVNMTQSSSDPSHPISSPRIPTTIRRHRSSSSSQSSTSRSQSLTSGVPPPSHLASGVASQASVERARDAAGIPDPNAGNYLHTHQPSRSRQGSMRSGQPSPASMPTSLHYPRERRSSQQASVARVEEAIAARESLDKTKAENEDLIKKVKQLEKQLRGLNGEAQEERGRLGQPRGMESSAMQGAAVPSGT